jgi:hypothetical protein
MRATAEVFRTTEGGDGPVVRFSEHSIARFPREWELRITPAEARRWSQLFDEEPHADRAAPDILYHPGMNMREEGRRYRGPLGRYSAEYRGALPIGRPIELTGGISELFVRRRRGYVTFDLEARVDGEVVQRHWRRFVLPLDEGEADGWAEAPEDEPVPEIPVTAERFGPRDLPCPQSRFDGFSLSGRPSMHTSAELAHELSLRATTAPAPVTFGLLTRLMRDRFGESFDCAGSIDARLVRPAFSGQTLRAHGAVLSTEGGRSTCRVWVEDEAGETVTGGVATATG